jgi:hypothetical protein
LGGEEFRAKDRRLVDTLNTKNAQIISKAIDELVEPDAVIRTRCRST